MSEPLVNMEQLSRLHYRNRVGNCWGDRETWPCRAWRNAETINTLASPHYAIPPEIAHEVLLPMLNDAAAEYRASRQRRIATFDALEAAG